MPGMGQGLCPTGMRGSGGFRPEAAAWAGGLGGFEGSQDPGLGGQSGHSSVSDHTRVCSRVKSAFPWYSCCTEPLALLSERRKGEGGCYLQNLWTP